MTWLDKTSKKTYWIGLVVTSVLFLISCEDPNEVGLGIVPQPDNLGVQFVDLPLTGSSVLSDSVRTSNLAILLAGKYEDDLFGSIKAQWYSKFFPLTPLPDEITEADSFQLQLRLNYFHGDDFSQPQTFSVHQLTEDLVDSLTYYSFQSTAFEEQSLGATTLVLDPEVDTILTINLTFPDNTFFEATKSFDPTDPDPFFEVIKGLALIPDENNTAILGFDPNVTSTRVALYYTTNDTVANVLSYPLGISQLSPLGVTQYHTIETDRSASSLAPLNAPLMEFEDPNGLLYLQAGTGIVPKLDFQSFFDFVQADTTGTIIVNQAELVIKNLQGLGNNFAPPAETTFFFADLDNRLVDIDSSDASFIPASIQTDQVYVDASQFNLDPLNLGLTSIRTELDSAQLDYTSQVGLFLQMIADGRFTNAEAQQILVYPFSFVSSGQLTLSNGRNLDRFVVNSSDIRLRIYYTFFK